MLPNYGPRFQIGHLVHQSRDVTEILFKATYIIKLTTKPVQTIGKDPFSMVHLFKGFVCFVLISSFDC